MSSIIWTPDNNFDPFDPLKSILDFLSGQAKPSQFDEEEREEMVTLAEELTQYVYDEKIPNIVFLDSSARLAYIGLSRVWDKNFQKEEKPNIYFLNPSGFPTNSWGMKKAVKSFRKSHTDLAKKTEEKVMILDTCYHTGKTAKRVLTGFNAAGFNEVYFGLMTQKPADCRYDVGFEAQRHYDVSSCYPFGIEYLIDRKSGGIISKVAKQSSDRNEGRELRKEIHQIFTDAGY